MLYEKVVILLVNKMEENLVVVLFEVNYLTVKVLFRKNLEEKKEISFLKEVQKKVKVSFKIVKDNVLVVVDLYEENLKVTLSYKIDSNFQVDHVEKSNDCIKKVKIVLVYSSITEGYEIDVVSVDLYLQNSIKKIENFKKVLIKN